MAATPMRILHLSPGQMMFTACAAIAWRVEFVIGGSFLHSKKKLLGNLTYDNNIHFFKK
jgi:hypothetical protein